MKTDKLKSFNLVSSKPNRSSLKKQEHECKKKEEEQHTEQVFKDFVASFEGNSKSRTWIKGGVVNTGSEDGLTDSGNSRVYRPTSKFDDLHNKPEVKPEPKRPSTEKPPTLGKKKPQEQKKSKLEQFKEELKLIQQQREQRHAQKQGKGGAPPVIHSELDLSDVSRSRDYKLYGGPPPQSSAGISGSGSPGSFYAKRRDRRDTAPMSLSAYMAAVDYPYDYDGDRTTTNLFLGNLNPKMTEQQLCDAFGRYGPLASVKIMWPRTEEERSRGRNCGFVAFMNRVDGERALDNIRGKELMGFEMKLGWGKSVPIPLYPVYIPPPLLELIKPPPPSGLPFNAQPREWLKSVRQAIKERAKMVTDGGAGESDTNVPPGPDRKPFDMNKMTKEEINDVLKDAVVKVVTPNDRSILALIHRVVEFVVLEGPQFEAAIMHREANNLQFKFMFDYQSSEHTYYRWKLWSIIHGESVNHWQSEEFRMFEGGPLWRPPPINLFTSGMPEELVEEDDYPYAPGYIPPPNSRRRDADGVLEDLHNEVSIARRCGLTEAQRGRFTQMLVEIEPSRSNIGDVMVWCLEHADSAADITDCIVYSMHPDFANNPAATGGNTMEAGDDKRDDQVARDDKENTLITNPDSGDLAPTEVKSEPQVHTSDSRSEDDQDHESAVFGSEINIKHEDEAPLPVSKLVARMFLVSDILYNSSAKVPNASYFRKCFENRLSDLFSQLHVQYKSADGILKAEQLKQKVIVCFRAWEEWAIYPNEFLIKLQNIFLGLTSDIDDEADLAGVPLTPEEFGATELTEAPKAFTVLYSDVEVLEGQSLVQYDGDPLDVDGSPLEDNEEPLIQATKLTTAADNKQARATGKPANRLFVPSKWETVDPETVESEAVSTTSRWELLVDPQQAGDNINASRSGDFNNKWSHQAVADEDELDGQPLNFVDGGGGFNLVAYDDEDVASPMSIEQDDSLDAPSLFTATSEGNRLPTLNPEPSSSSTSSSLTLTAVTALSEERRALLREIEVKVMKYQDDLEASRKTNTSITDEAINKQTRRYRERLMDRLTEDEQLMALKHSSKRTPSSVSKTSRSNQLDRLSHSGSKYSSSSPTTQTNVLSPLSSSRRKDYRDRSPPRSFRDRTRCLRPSSSPVSASDNDDSATNGSPHNAAYQKSAAFQKNHSTMRSEELEEGEASDEDDSVSIPVSRGHSKRKRHIRECNTSSDYQQSVNPKSVRKKHCSRSPDSQNSPNRRHAGGVRRR